MRRRILILLFAIAIALHLAAQINNPTAQYLQGGPSLPATCTARQTWVVGPSLYIGVGSSPCVWYLIATGTAVGASSVNLSLNGTLVGNSISLSVNGVSVGAVSSIKVNGN